MIFSRHIYFIILLHILLILFTSGTGIWMIVSHTGYVIGFLFILCSLLQIAGLTHRLNKFNQKIRLFFDAVQDRESMLHFPEQNVGKEQKQLNRAFNRLNDLLIKLKEENQKQEHFYRSLIEEVPAGVLAWNASGRIIIANNAAFTLLRCNRLYDQKQLALLLNETGIRNRLSISSKQMVLQGETITLLSIKDIGDELSDKENESWSKLTHVLTHEIMNTIAPVISLSQTLSTYPDNNTKTVRGLQIIQAQSERLMEFTESFRHLSYMPHPEKKLFSITTLLANLIALLQSDFEERKIYFSMQCTPTNIEYNGDENQLSQVFLNLFKNAMQAVDQVPEKSIFVKVKVEDGKLIIDITDNGPGIPNELKERIFIPFFTTKTEGTGIGLSLCKQIVRQHKGHLSLVESLPGKTTFRIDLPQ